MVALSSLSANPRNPNTHSEEQIRLLAKIIKGNGWRAPITVSMRSGLVVRGHGRLLAAIKLGVKTAPVDYQNYTSDAAEWADLIADNRIAELAEINKVTLRDVLLEIDTGENDMELTGFSPGELEMLMTQSGAPAEEKSNSSITCPECGHIFALCP